MAKGYKKGIRSGNIKINLDSIKAKYGMSALLNAKYDEEIMNEFLNDPVVNEAVPSIKSINGIGLKIIKGMLVLNGGYDLYANNINELKEEKRKLAEMDKETSTWLIKNALNNEQR